MRTPTLVTRIARTFSSKPSTTTKATKQQTKRVVLVDGARIPFQPSRTTYNDQMAYDLSRLAITGLLKKTAIDPTLVDYVTWGTVIQEPKTSNIARDAALAAGVPISVPSHTVTMACISSNQAICSGASHILANQGDIVLAGGVETFSDAPIRFQRSLRKKFIAMSRAKSPGQMASIFFKGLKLADLAPDAPQVANFLTGEGMGNYSDRLADRFGVSRADQDEFALRSHVKAAAAHADGFYDDEVLPLGGSRKEDGVRGDSTLEKMASLKPAFQKPYGTVTAANATPFTDGASAVLIMSEEKALELGLKPKAYIKAFEWVACDPFEDLLLGPAVGTAQILKKTGLALADMDVIEFHEAFASQVLANVNALDSQDFFDKKLGGMPKVGAIDFNKFNTRGGSISIGHPFGATGARIVTTAANRLIAEGGRYALLAACADGGLGHACILERYNA